MINHSKIDRIASEMKRAKVYKTPDEIADYRSGEINRAFKILIRVMIAIIMLYELSTIPGPIPTSGEQVLKTLKGK